MSKSNLVNLLSAPLPAWVSDSFPIIRIVLMVAIVLLSIAMIIIVMIQPSNSQGVGGLTGQSDTFYSKNKSKTLEGTFKRLTVIIGCALVVLTILFFVTLIIYAGNI